MVLDYEYSKMKLPKKGFSYPIKKTELDAALEKAGVTDVKRVGYAFSDERSQDGREPLISASLFREARQGYWLQQSPRIVICSISSSLNKEITELIVKKQILEKMANWLKKLEGAESVRRDFSQIFRASYYNGDIEIEQT